MLPGFRSASSGLHGLHYVYVTSTHSVSDGAVHGCTHVRGSVRKRVLTHADDVRGYPFKAHHTGAGGHRQGASRTGPLQTAATAAIY